MFLHGWGKHEVNGPFDDFSTICISPVVEFGIIELMEKVTADFKFLFELEKCRFLDIRIAVVLLVLFSVIMHSLFESFRNADIVNHQTTGFT